MTFAYKKESDSGAPSYASSSAGSVIAILDWFLVTILGWTKPYSGTNIAVYRQAAAPYFYLRVDDTATLDVRLRVYETMSDVNTGTNPTPTDVQASGGLYFRRWSTGAGYYRIAGNSTTFTFAAQYSSSPYWDAFSFGNFIPYASTDTKNVYIIANESRLADGYPQLCFIRYNVNTSQLGGHYLCSTIDGVSESRYASKTTDGKTNQTYAGGSGGCAYPDPVTAKLRISPFWVVDSTERVCRGYIPGIWNIGHNIPFTGLDTFTGNSGPGAGRSFEVIASDPVATQFLLETSDTWGGYSDLL